MTGASPGPEPGQDATCLSGMRHPGRKGWVLSSMSQGMW